MLIEQSFFLFETSKFRERCELMGNFKTSRGLCLDNIQEISVLTIKIISLKNGLKS